MYVIADAVFGLAIGLSAFSLTELEITSINDVYFAIGFFFLTFFFISLFWMWVRRFFDAYPVRGAITGILYLLCFLVAILPFIMRLFFTGMYGGTPEVSLIAQTWLYPLDMGAISLLVFGLHMLFLKQGRGSVPWEEYRHIAKDGFAASIFGVGFLLTAVAPLEQTFADLLMFSIPPPLADVPAKIGIWFLLIVAAIPVWVVIHLSLKRLERSYHYGG